MANMAKIKLYYFSGSGNSWHVARELEKIIPEVEIVPIVKQLKDDITNVDARAIGFVFPIHLSTVPLFIRDWIKKMNLQSVQYIFAVATRIGTQHSAFRLIDKALKMKNKKLCAHFSINMPSNDPKFGFKTLTEKETADSEARVQKQLVEISEVVSNRVISRKKDTTYTSRVPLVNVLAVLVALTDNMQQSFYVDDKCDSCGTCEKVCLSGKIKMISEKPTWLKEVKCLKCYACLNFCPEKAVQIKGFTEEKDRYSHPYATAEDIARQKI
jgi:ferredoxin/flavodoxin